MTEQEIELALAEHLPSWADKKLEGEYEQYAQLQTRDGRAMGNAVICYVLTEEMLPDYMKDMAPIYGVTTDFGHTVRMTTAEMNRQFHPPQWRMKADRARLRIAYARGYFQVEQALSSEN